MVEPWAQLVSTTDIESDPVLIMKNKFTIGRASGSDLCLSNNKMISGSHCFIERDEIHHTVWLHDTSTNGTLLNKKEKLSHQKVELKHGDEIYVVCQKDDTSQNVAYLFQDIEDLRQEELNSTDEYSPKCDETLPYDNEDSSFESVKPSLKRLVDEISNEGDVEAKKTKLKEIENDIVVAIQTEDSKTKDDIVAVVGGTSKSVEAETLKRDPCAETSNTQKSTSPAGERDGIEESLLCIICQEILYNCISIQPCLHSFCAGCYSDWMGRSKECPSCRTLVERISKNHMVNNLVEAYLEKHPEKKRPDDDLKELDAKNLITSDMLELPKRNENEDLYGYMGDSNSDSNEDSDQDSDEDSDTDVEANNRNRYRRLLPPTPRTVCRQCPDYPGLHSLDAAGAPNTMNYYYCCRQKQDHVLCGCCIQPMPDLRIARRSGAPVPPQECSVCSAAYCHLYWGCRRIDCEGCLRKFEEMHFGTHMLGVLILNNFYESDVLTKYLESKSLSITDLMKTCAQKLFSGEYTCSNEDIIRQPNSAVCRKCALNNLCELAYQYRRDIPADQLPATVTSRPDCHWGRNCRTQTSKYAHAANFNHICEQTRMA